MPTPSYQPSVMEFDELPKKPADLSWNIFCLVFGLHVLTVELMVRFIPSTGPLVQGSLMLPQNSPAIL